MMTESNPCPPVKAAKADSRPASDLVRASSQPVFAASETMRCRGVHAEDHAAVGAQDLSRNLAEKAQPDDAHELAEPGVGLPDALHGNRSQRGEGGCVEPDGVGNLDDQVLRDRDNAGMRGVAAAAARDAVAGLEAPLGVHGRENGAGAAVAQFLQGLELGPYPLERLRESFLAPAVEHLPDKVRALAGLAKRGTPGPWRPSIARCRR